MENEIIIKINAQEVKIDKVYEPIRKNAQVFYVDLYLNYCVFCYTINRFYICSASFFE